MTEASLAPDQESTDFICFGRFGPLIAIIGFSQATCESGRIRFADDDELLGFIRGDQNLLRSFQTAPALAQFSLGVPGHFKDCPEVRDYIAKAIRGGSMSPNDLPIDEMDPAIIDLCRAINEFPGLRTSGSCQGFVDGHKPGEPWCILFRTYTNPPTLEAWTSLEFVTDLCNNIAKHSDFKVTLAMYSPPPHFNEPSECLFFAIEGFERHPNAFAKFVRTVRDECFYLPSPEDE